MGQDCQARYEGETGHQQVDEERAISGCNDEGIQGMTEIQKAQTSGSRGSKRSKLSCNVSKTGHETDAEIVAPTILPESDLSQGIVGWESQDDPEMPLNFASSRKWLIVSSLALITFMSPLSSSILSPAIDDTNKTFNNSNITKGAFPVSIYLLGYAVGPLFLAPLSEIFGRALVLTCANIFFCLWHIGCALAPSLDALIAFRFLSGVGGSGCLTLGGAVIGDMFPVVERGRALSLWVLGPLVGPTIGPLIGAFITGSIGWRWAPWIVLIPSAIVTLVLALTLPETNHKVLINHKIKRLSKGLGRNDLKNCYETSEASSMSHIEILKTSLLRPLRMLAFAPIVTALSIYNSFIYGTVYLMYNSISPTFEEQYSFSTGITGVVFLSLGVGYMAGLASFSMLSDRTVVRLTKANGGVYEPEMRLNLIVYYACIVPTTFFWYGWSADKQVHWIVPILGLFPLSVGIIGVYMPTQAYIVDAYNKYSASGLAAFTVLRSVTAAFLPLAGPELFANLGLGWGNAVLGFIAIALILIPIVVYKFGMRLRKRYPLKL
ncbi:major facilitator superfamily domain-containing protein [Xylariaceae sp. FL0016]|nr:major facilitator superfamily domain-containing protein [Xylariaceae sp. FL0016]